MRPMKLSSLQALAIAAILAVSGMSAKAQEASSAPQGGETLSAASSTQFTLSGAVKTPKTYDKAALAALPQTSLKVGNTTYTGVSLWSLIEDAGLVTDPAIKADVLRKVVLATASDGYKVAISAGEIHPNFGNQPCLVALQQNGADFTSGGFVRLIFPNDVKRGRWVHDLTELKITELP